MPTILSRLQAWIDPKLEDAFNAKPHDPTRDRDWLVMRLQSAKTQYAATETTRGGGKRTWKLSNGVVAFSPVRRDGQPLVINGTTTNFIPSEHFDGFLTTMIEAVQAGEFDSELASNTPAGTSVAISPTRGKPRQPRKSKPQGEGSGWSEERRAKFAATVAARKAAANG